ncbi:MAG: rod-binding protein [Lachnospiraceae bacterium]|nr:rod-binding protein [Lachnospiraceae bacterium]MDD3660270.1 rod-binding protein [Lachnospiraceae bacterium]
MEIDGISSIYTDYLSNASESLDKTSSIKSKNYATATEDELLEACKEFETYFLEQVFKEMQKTVDLTGSENSSNKALLDYYEDNMVQELATQSTEQNSLGLAQTLYEQMKRNYDI